MYKVRNTVYSEGGKILIGENKIGYKFDGDLEEELGVLKIGDFYCCPITSSEADEYKYLKND